MEEVKKGLKALLAWRESGGPDDKITVDLAYCLENLILALTARDIDVACMYDEYQLLVDGPSPEECDEED